MRLPIPPLLAILVPTLSVAVPLRAELDLIGTADGIEYRLAEIAGGRASLTDGYRTVPLTPGIEWRIHGDLKVNSRMLDLSPTYSLVRQHKAPGPAEADKTGRAVVSVRSPAPGSGESHVVVVVWTIDGQPVRVVVEAEALQGSGDAEQTSIRLDLSEDEMRGVPFVLYWKDGAFIDLPDRFATAPTQRAFIAAIFNDVEMFEAAIADGADLREETEKEKWTLAHYAAEADSVEVMDSLLKLDRRLALHGSRRYLLPLQVAASKGRSSMLSSLMEKTRKGTRFDNATTAALLDTLSHGHIKCLQVLLDTKDLAKDHDLGRSLMLGAFSADSPAIADAVMRAKFRYKFESDEAVIGLLNLTQNGSSRMAQWLIQNGCDPVKAGHGDEVLTAAAQHGSSELVRRLLELGANPNSRGEGGLTPLIAAASTGNTSAARNLLDAGADVAAATDSGTTALHAAAVTNGAELATLLVSLGADPNARSDSLLTPLDVALVTGARETAILLADSGSEVSIGSDSSDVALQQAIRFDIPKVIASAIEHGWPAQSNFAGLWPAVRVASVFGSEACVDMLTKHGATLDEETPFPLVGPRELDSPISVSRAISPADPRPIGTVHPTATVVVDFLVDPEGRPLFPSVRSTDDPRLAAGTLNVIGDWRFNPPRKDGREVAARVAVPIRYSRTDRTVRELAEVSKLPVATEQVPPVHPRELRRNRIEGSATLEFVVLTDGTVAKIRVLSATHRAFAASAVLAVQRWQFRPGEVDGRPVNVRVRQQINFHL